MRSRRRSHAHFGQNGGRRVVKTADLQGAIGCLKIQDGAALFLFSVVAVLEQHKVKIGGFQAGNGGIFPLGAPFVGVSRPNVIVQGGNAGDLPQVDLQNGAAEPVAVDLGKGHITRGNSVFKYLYCSRRAWTTLDVNGPQVKSKYFPCVL